MAWYRPLRNDIPLSDQLLRRFVSKSRALAGSLRRPGIAIECASQGSLRVGVMKFLRLYVRVLELLGPEARLGWALALAGVALAAANFVEPILFGRIVDALANAQGGSRQLDWGVLLPLVGAWVGFGLFIIVASTDRLAARRSARAPPLPGGAGGLFRAHPAIAAELSHRHAFRPADEGDDHRHQYAVGHVALVLPRAFHQLHLAVHPDAADAVPQLALRAAADAALRRLRRADRVRPAQDRDAAKHSRDLLHRSGGAHLRHARQHRPDPELRAHRHGSRRDAQGRHAVARRADAGAVVVGAGDRADQGLDHHHHAGDPDRRHRLLHPRPDDGRRDRDVHELRHHADRQARAGRALRQPHGDGRAAAAGILRRARHHSRRARPPRRGRSRPPARADRVQGRQLLLRRQAAGGAGPELHRAARARPLRWSARPAPASRPRSRCCTASTIRNRAW